MGTPPQSAQAALALSGGGFRATLFHLGSLWRLNELGCFNRLACVAGVSGGAIDAAYLGLKWRQLSFGEDGVATNYVDEVVEPVRRLCMHSIDVTPTLVNFALSLFGVQSTLLEQSYRRLLFSDAMLSDWPKPGKGPRIVVEASNLQTGCRVAFSREMVRDRRLGLLHALRLSLARVVAASTAYPPFLSPVIVRAEPASWQALPESDLAQETRLKSRLVLTDGGIHDPQGLVPIWSNYDTLLVSDASHTRQVWRRPTSNWFRQLNRTTLMQTVTSSLSRRELLLAAYAHHPPLRQGAYWANDSLIDSYGLTDILTHDSATTRALSSMRTRLNRFSPAEQGRLINWGYALCDAALRASGLADNAPPAIWPLPDYAL